MQVAQGRKCSTNALQPVILQVQLKPGEMMLVIETTNKLGVIYST